MSRVTRTHTWHHHISSKELRVRLGLDTIDYYVARRQLRWLGHVARMDFGRLPRRMLSSWVPHKRPVGAPRFTLGRTVAKAMDVFRLDRVHWPELAADRVAWRAMPQSGDAPPGFRQAPAPERRRAAWLPAGAGAGGADADVALFGAASTRCGCSDQPRHWRVAARLRQRQQLEPLDAARHRDFTYPFHFLPLHLVQRSLPAFK